MTDIYKLIRYNTGTDKKLFVEFAENFDAVIMNATIAAYSGSAMADLVSIYKDKYIIDPQTYILQQEYETLKSETSKKGGIKKSIQQYLKQLPSIFLDTLVSKHYIPTQIINDNLDTLVNCVGEFEINYINSFIKTKEYNKYLDFINESMGGAMGKPQPRLIIAPYFMLKNSYSNNEMSAWINLNQSALNSFISKFDSSNYPIAAQLVLEKSVLDSLGDDTNLLEKIIRAYTNDKFEMIFIWIDNFSPLESDIHTSKAFAKLVKELNRIGKKPIMSYGGYDSILLCHKDSPTRLYGVAQSVGYGEKRQITPVGGGLPINKYYFPLTHQRLKTEDVGTILSAKGYFDSNFSKKERAHRFYSNICACPQCKKIIGDNFDNFNKYNLSIAFTMRSGIRRNRPTQEALDISSRHFLYNKKYEWDSILTNEFKDLVEKYKTNISTYCFYYDRALYTHIIEWIKNYAE
ncbi:MAG: hypothetical protein K2I67_02560 [Malacoplasma sp.]|nr:hypothetical protein [Malacoplasma sp.]